MSCYGEGQNGKDAKCIFDDVWFITRIALVYHLNIPIMFDTMFVLLFFGSYSVQTLS